MAAKVWPPWLSGLGSDDEDVVTVERAPVWKGRRVVLALLLVLESFKRVGLSGQSVGFQAGTTCI